MTALKFFQHFTDERVLYSDQNDACQPCTGTVMTNIDFNLGFLINRENLDKYINRNTDYNSFETSNELKNRIRRSNPNTNPKVRMCRHKLRKNYCWKNYCWRGF